MLYSAYVTEMSFYCRRENIKRQILMFSCARPRAISEL